jgi:ferritin-like metal-binding protein YciE
LGKHADALEGIDFDFNSMGKSHFGQSVRDNVSMAGAQRTKPSQTATYGTTRAFALLKQDNQSAAQWKRILKAESTTFNWLM